MRGLLSFLLVMLLAEVLLMAYSLYSEQARSDYSLIEQALHMQDSYFAKIKMKRDVQNILLQPCTRKDPYECIEETAHRLAEYELVAEQSQAYKVDVWCGYLAPTSLELMSQTWQAGFATKPPGIFEPSQKVIIFTRGGPKELHACSLALVHNYDSEKVSIGRGHIPDDLDNSVPLLPAIGISIADTQNGIYDVDYVGAI